jgi:hypothetical protein
MVLMAFLPVRNTTTNRNSAEPDFVSGQIDWLGRVAKKNFSRFPYGEDADDAHHCLYLEVISALSSRPTIEGP